ncbi:TFIIH subunit Tfb4/p34 [Xylariaceae sp. FL0255]|nr:TFIIH subunit Tfb4/p34 [Xylariaceae sp. FL0255]
MNRIDASDHYDETGFTSAAPSLLTVIIDTNPRAWAAIHSELPISNAIANILVFINAHLAFGNENQVAVLAAHTSRAVWLYPPSPNRDDHSNGDRDGDVEMQDRETIAPKLGTSANKYPQFAQIESTIITSLRSLISSTSPSDLPPSSTTSQISGALSLALCHIHKTAQAYEPPKTSTDPAQPVTSATIANGNKPTGGSNPNLHARILVISVSESAPAQYIPTMNAVFAASHAGIPIDTLSLNPVSSSSSSSNTTSSASTSTSAPFLQQAAFITNGIYLSASSNPRALLTYLTFGLLPDTLARKSLVTPTLELVDFRAACFCHRKVINTGFVCSICLSIFCDIPQDAECLTCGTKLSLGDYGAKPAVVPRKKKKKGKKLNGVTGREETGSLAGTPVPGG